MLKVYNEFPENQTYISKKDLTNVLYNILYFIRIELNKLCDNFMSVKEINNQNEIHSKIDYKIESNSELNNFTSKDIQDENKIITRAFQAEANNYMTLDEQVENENVALFCKKVAKISRISYNASFSLFKTMKKQFIELKNNKISLTGENFRKEFSFWIKSSEIEKNIFREYKDILNREFPFKINENSNEEKYLMNLFYDLSLLYFHCHIAFPLVEIDFKTEEDFDYIKMIDFINRGKRKVNFVILPSLISNGCYLENGKSWVFTYHKDSFRFEEREIEELNNILCRKNPNVERNKNGSAIRIVLTRKNN